MIRTKSVTMNELKFEVKGNTYTIKVPTAGDMIDIERLKMILSGGYYNEMMRTTTISAQESLLIIDIQACFSILNQKLMQDLKCEDIKKLSIEDYRVLRTAYMENFVPWWNNWLKLFKGEEKSGE
jgi:hypothetical protein